MLEASAVFDKYGREENPAEVRAGIQSPVNEAGVHKQGCKITFMYVPFPIPAFEASPTNGFLLLWVIALAVGLYRTKHAAAAAAKQHRLELEAINAKAQEYARVLEEQTQKIEQINQMLQSKNEALEKTQAQSEQLLLNVLPLPIAQRLKEGEATIADSFEEVTVLFADIVGFTALAAQVSPAEIVDLLNRVFSLLDIFSEQYVVEKIKTIGDAYMIVGGVPEPREGHVEAVADMALEIQQTIALLTYSLEIPVQVRIGMHTGPAVAGVIGKKKFSYDLWGDTVNTASRLESHGEPGKIHVSEAVYHKLKDAYIFEERGTIEIKGKGMMRTFFLVDKLEFI